MRLDLATWPEVETYLAAHTGILMPIGSTEQHGPNGLIGTDAICAEAIAHGVGAVTGALVAPTINVGMAQHHLAFPGTITLRPTTLIAVICDMVDSLARHGFRKFFFINGHGGNIATAGAAFSEIYAARSLQAGDHRAGIRCVLRNWWEAPAVGKLARSLFADAEGSHATPSEVSLTWAVYPEAVKTVELSPRRAPTGHFTDAEDYRRKFPDGRIGSEPGLASVEHGQALLRTAIDALAGEYRSFADGPA